MILFILQLSFNHLYPVSIVYLKLLMVCHPQADATMQDPMFFACLETRAETKIDESDDVL